MALDDELRALNRAYNDYVDGSVDGLIAVIRQILARAIDRVTARLAGRLSPGTIGQRAEDVRTAQQIQQLIIEEAERGGLFSALEEWAGSWGYQARFLNDTLRVLGLPQVTLTAEQQAALAAQQAAGVGALNAEIAVAAARAERTILGQMGRIGFADLIALMRDEMDASLEEAKAIADTAITTFYRSMNASAAEVIEAERGPLQYRYYGPDDKLARPFCRRLLDSRRSYTREQIDAMDNGQMPDVFLTCGGWRCRHQWIVDISKGPLSNV